MCAHSVGADGGKTAGGLRRRQTIRTRREVAKDIVSWRTRRAPQRIRRSRYHERCLVDQILPGRTISTPCLLCTRRRFHTRRSSCRRWGAGGPNSARSRTVALSLLSPVASARLITGAVKGPARRELARLRCLASTIRYPKSPKSVFVAPNHSTDPLVDSLRRSYSDEVATDDNPVALPGDGPTWLPEVDLPTGKIKATTRPDHDVKGRTLQSLERNRACGFSSAAWSC